MPKSITVRDNRGGNWWWAHNVVIDGFVETGRLKGLEAMVYFVLCRVSRDGEGVAPIPVVARKAGVSERFAQQAIRRLEALGLLRVERRRDDRGWLPSRYTLLAVPGAGDAPPGAGERDTLAQEVHRVAQDVHPNKNEHEEEEREDVASPPSKGMSAEEMVAILKRSGWKP